jgi:pyruvate/2-oxoglutarate dehydrogenase complex dihydrolipoamide acyltransferase (E2) component
MPVEVILPKLGSTMTRGTITKWLKAEGDPVDEGEPLFEFETDKAVMEVEARQAGVLGRILAPVGATVPVAQVVALILAPGEAMPEEARPEKPGPGAVPAPPAAPPPSPPAFRGEGIRAGGIRAPRLAESLDTTAQVTLTIEVDATELVKWRARWQEEAENSPGFSISDDEIMVKIVATALREHPQVNATLTEEGIQLLTSINVGVVVNSNRGTIVPVVHGADGQDIVQIARNLRALVERAKAGESRPDDLNGGTFTIANLGRYEIDAFTPIINLPECAILGVGRIQAKPVAYQGKIEARQMMYLSLSFDHRLVDGAPAARFLQRVKRLIENPHLILEGKHQEERRGT